MSENSRTFFQNLSKISSQKNEEFARLEAKLLTWIAAVLGETAEGDFKSSLETGVWLCNLANKIQPNIVKKIHTRAQNIPGLQMDNITAFINACKQLGIAETDLFHPTDIRDNRNRHTVIACLQLVAEIANKSGLQPQYEVENLVTLGLAGAQATRTVIGAKTPVSPASPAKSATTPASAKPATTPAPAKATPAPAAAKAAPAKATTTSAPAPKKSKKRPQIQISTKNTVQPYSDELLYAVSKTRNCFVSKKAADGVRFSSDPFNLTKINSHKAAGYVRSNAVGVNVTGKNKKGKLVTKILTKKSNFSPKINQMTIKKDGVDGAKTIVAHTAATGQTKAAVASFCRQRKAELAANPVKKQKTSA